MYYCVIIGNFLPVNEQKSRTTSWSSSFRARSPPASRGLEHSSLLPSCSGPVYFGDGLRIWLAENNVFLCQQGLRGGEWTASTVKAKSAAHGVVVKTCRIFPAVPSRRGKSGLKKTKKENQLLLLAQSIVGMYWDIVTPLCNYTGKLNESRLNSRVYLFICLHGQIHLMEMTLAAAACFFSSQADTRVQMVIIYTRFSLWIPSGCCLCAECQRKQKAAIAGETIKTRRECVRARATLRGPKCVTVYRRRGMRAISQRWCSRPVTVCTIA